MRAAQQASLFSRVITQAMERRCGEMRHVCLPALNAPTVAERLPARFATSGISRSTPIPAADDAQYWKTAAPASVALPSRYARPGVKRAGCKRRARERLLQSAGPWESHASSHSTEAAA